MNRILFSLLALLAVPAIALGQIAQWAQAFRQTKGVAGAHSGICIYEPATGKYLYQYQDDKYFIPASNTKILTAFTALTLLGDSLAAFRYEAGKDTLFIQGTADPSFLHPVFIQQNAFTWLKAVNKPIALVPMPNDNMPFGPGWSWEDYETEYQPERNEWPMYGNVVTIYHRWKADSIAPSFFKQPIATKVDNTLTEATGGRAWHSNQFYVQYPARNNNTMQARVPFITGSLADLAARLADTLHRPVTVMDTRKLSTPVVFYSRPVDSILRYMMYESDDGMAEQMLMAASSRLLDTLSTPRVIDWMLSHSLKDLPEPPHWVDGSGLSRYNLVTPRDLVAVLHKLTATFPASRVYALFPTAGHGTLTNHYAGMEGAIYAKTGSFGNCFNLSGYLFTRKKRKLIFSVMVNNHNDKNTNIRIAVEQLLRKIYEQE
ncbi:D-alanyl-D-alanine carboxypeptidase / D-alanyl-D-alanine-endopeptidase (penicillin-binding protein 4) [Chitinophaga costaii]|uniref:D-alanyl-D-alanine carboxypeptidase / D-alanyl-D-alanine-endopeptidase (Penicillin-binding protein 4) n=1 Tax=Chitinophaga costaii TaxID=1335309 RepID=A0A1C4AD73_9BACT|nr:D-alanyl-D-alanine carboxypeptidase [Chitinophaga costaii]PUZ26563.1 D-alanyl-D-alanine carboxypeptidase [Chitinophaga costaii]SCB92628.1 D-alanyl-D-alanine carboxypeptidase / D-alanyl-D-alanine-endopeptidase (penicillin-binding protein 4) [Chitinophaga costaii]